MLTITVHGTHIALNTVLNIFNVGILKQITIS